MTIDRSKSLAVLFVAFFALLTACGSDKEKSAEGSAPGDTVKERDFSNDRAQDKAEIQALFDEY